MADAQRRRLARVAQGGDVHVAARVLRDRTRSGALSSARLALAAALGAPAARLAAERPPAAIDLRSQDWPYELPDRSQEVCVRLAVAAARAVLPLHALVAPDDPLPAEALRVAEEWALCPCEEHAAAAQEACRRMARGSYEVVAPAAECDEDRDAARYAARAARAAATTAGWPDTALLDLFEGALDAVPAVTAADLAADRAHASPQDPMPRMIADMAAEVVPWALGEDDPLRRRR